MIMMMMRVSCRKYCEYIGQRQTCIDFRSDTVTLPSRDMLDSIVNSAFGDDGYGEDITSNLLEREVKDLFK